MAYLSTAFSTAKATSGLLKVYRAGGLQAVERQRLFLLSPHRAGAGLFNLGLELHDSGDENDAEIVWRRSAELGFPPAMWNLAVLLGKRGDHDEAREMHRRALEAGMTPPGGAPGLQTLCFREIPWRG
jgi:hypothetical protein